MIMRSHQRLLMNLSHYKVILLGCLLASQPLRAGEAGAPTGEDLDKVVEAANHLGTELTPITLSGYVDAGYLYNFSGSSANVATQGYVNDGFTGGDFNLHAVKLVLEKSLSESNAWQGGFRVDLMVGEDVSTFSGQLPGSFFPGSSDGLYVQQGYCIVRAPVGNGLDIQAGRINSILGFEADERPANMNITLGVNSFFDPGPAAGILLTYPVSDLITLLAGVNNGNGLSTSRGVGVDTNGDTLNDAFETGDGYAFSAGVGLANEKGNAETQVAVQYSPWGDEALGMTENEGLAGINWWGTWAPVCCRDRFLLAFNSSLWNAGDFSAPAIPGPAGDDGSTFVTFALYAKYQFTDVFSLAGRAEFTHTDDDQFLGLEPGLAPVQGSNDVASWTVTAGLDLLENLLLRAEYRLDTGSDVLAGPGGSNGDFNHMVATQVVFSF
jgi:hypothetical protein